MDEASEIVSKIFPVYQNYKDHVCMMKSALVVIEEMAAHLKGGSVEDSMRETA